MNWLNANVSAVNPFVLYSSYKTCFSFSNIKITPVLNFISKSFLI